MAKQEQFVELGMVPELAKYVAGAVGGIDALRGTFVMNGVTPVVVGNTNLAAGGPARSAIGRRWRRRQG